MPILIYRMYMVALVPLVERVRSFFIFLSNDNRKTVEILK